MSKAGFTPQVVHHIAQLANVSVTPAEEESLSQAFQETITVVAQMSQLDTKNTQPTHQVTGLQNIWRDDVVDTTRTFSQEDALSNAAKTHAGFFVVPQLIEQKDA